MTKSARPQALDRRVCWLIPQAGQKTICLRGVLDPRGKTLYLDGVVALFAASRRCGGLARQ
ncbi:MAG TPA: hypothetical protein VIF02_05260 [Methylocella sp.]|jgi:hypothetical protein